MTEFLTNWAVFGGVLIGSLLCFWAMIAACIALEERYGFLPALVFLALAMSCGFSFLTTIAS